jgi:two-component system NarL family sensor kinase
LFEVYFDYASVEAQQNSLWMRFSAVVLGSVVLLLAALLPLLRNLIRSLDRGHAQRQLLLQRAVDASDTERRRIAALLHDGPVQELVGASYFLGAAGMRLDGTEGGRILEDAETTVRATVDTLRVLLLDLYPPSLTESGLDDALELLAYNAEHRGSTLTVDVGSALRLSKQAEQLTFRVARETIANAVKHGEGKPVSVTLRREHQQTVLTVTDDGPGFEAESLIANPQAAHFGLRTLRDAVAESGIDASLSVKSAPKSGTSWRLSVVC